MVRALTLLSMLIFGSSSAIGAAECPSAGGLYEGFRVVKVSIETPLRFPVGWIERALVGPAVDSLDSIADGLVVKEDSAFHFADHIKTIETLRSRYTVLNPGERLKATLILPRFPACDFTAQTVEVVYRVYTTDAAYFASRVLASAQAEPGRKLTIGEASETEGQVINVPFAGYNHTRRIFGGMRSAWSGNGSIFNSGQVEAGGSSTSYQTMFALGGVRNPDRGTFSHVEWTLGFQASNEPTESAATQKITELRKSIGTAQFFAATRAKGKFGAMFRFGASIEDGKSKTVAENGGAAKTDPQRVLKSFLGITANHNKHLLNATYGFQVGWGTENVPVNYTKHIADFSHQSRFLWREHRPLEVETHVNAGWIRSGTDSTPVVERFFGGNAVTDFVNNPLWKVPSGPLLRSIPQNGLNMTRGGQANGGTTFFALNETIAFPVWNISAVPSIVRNAKPLADGIHLGLQQAQAASLEDYRARTDRFPAVLTRAVAVIPDLKKVRDVLTSLPRGQLPEELADDISDLLTTYLDPALADIDTAQKLPRSGLAWSICRRLAGADPDTFPLAHIHDDIRDVVSPGLIAANHAREARELESLAARLDRDRLELVMLLAPIEPFVAVDRTRLDAFNPDLMMLMADAGRLEIISDALLGEDNPVGPSAQAASEWSVAILNSADLGPDVTPQDVLYTLGRLAIGIGKLVPAQIESGVRAADNLAAVLDPATQRSTIDELHGISGSLRQRWVQIASRVRSLALPPGERWARQQNEYFVRALDVTFREMNLAAVSPVLLFDVARIGPVQEGISGFRYGAGPAVRLSIVTFQVTAGYSFNLNRRFSEGSGAFFFSMVVADLFR